MGKAVTVGGQRFGLLIATDIHHRVPKRVTWRCVCDCGRDKLATAYELTSGLVRNCGCQRKQRERQGPKPLEGCKFGKLQAKHVVEHRKSLYYWHCECECGATCIREQRHLLSCKSCGCHRQKHGGAVRRVRRNPIYRTWCRMKRRCLSPKDPKYPLYGGRGIRVCDRWLNDFAAFRDDMGPRPPGLSLERIDVDGDYEPKNCCWADASTQAHNRRSSLWYRRRRDEEFMKQLVMEAEANISERWEKK